MSARRIHEPPPQHVVDALVRAGVSLGTALAMERWKAAEVLDLLQQPRPGLGIPGRHQPAW